MKTLVYYNGGDICLQEVEKTRNQIKKEAKKFEQIGYLSGYRYWNNIKQSVMVFFKEKPTTNEIACRRNNGLRAAKWNYI